jgi:hypothetical protein
MIKEWSKYCYRVRWACGARVMSKKGDMVLCLVVSIGGRVKTGELIEESRCSTLI